MHSCVSIIRVGEPNYWEHLRREREKDMHLFTPKADIRESFCTERISNCILEVNIKSIPIIHGAYKTVPVFRVEKVKIYCSKMQIYLAAGCI